MFAAIATIASGLALAQADAPPPDVAARETAVREIFEEWCTSCHDDSDDLDLTVELSQLIGMPSAVDMAMVEPGQPDASYLYVKIAGGPHMQDDLMPLGDDPLSEPELAAVRDWIANLDPQAVPASVPADESSAASLGADVAAREEGPRWKRLKPRPTFFGTHQVNLNTTTTLGKRAIEMRVHHRFGWVGKPGDGDRSYLGLASGAVMSLGVAYGIVDGLDVMLRWTNSRLDWELGVKYVPLRQEDGDPLSLGAYASVEWLSEDPNNVANPWTANAQVMLARLWFGYWSTQLLVNYSWLTNHSPRVMLDMDGADGPEGPVRVNDKRGTLGIGFASTVWLGERRRVGIDLEYYLPIPAGGEPNAFFYRGSDADPTGSVAGSWSLGVSARAGLHLFQVMVSNTRNIHTNLMAVGGDSGNPFKPFGGFLFGFNISRKWKL